MRLEHSQHGWLLATSYSNNLLPMIPFIFTIQCLAFKESMTWLGLQEIQEQKDFFLATSGRTTLNGEGLQHQDGHSHIMAGTIPNCKSYDPCFFMSLKQSSVRA